jgi:hypothetical protein
MAALAAGVGITALTETADAKVVITTNISIPISGVTQMDLNNDGVEDIAFSVFRTGCHGCTTSDLYARGAVAGNDVQGKSGVSALARSAKIGITGRGTLVPDGPRWRTRVSGWNTPTARDRDGRQSGIIISSLESPRHARIYDVQKKYKVKIKGWHHAENPKLYCYGIVRQDFALPPAFNTKPPEPQKGSTIQELFK